MLDLFEGELHYRVMSLTQTERNKWADALESGLYQQGRGYLRQGDKYCCLGVYGEVCGINAEAHGDYDFELDTVYSFDGHVSILPSDIMDPQIQYDLAYLNDKGMTFEEIAKIIRDGHVPSRHFEPTETKFD